MIITLGVLLVTSSLLVAVFTSSIGEIKLTSSDTAAKKAYYAAQAGISDYMYHLTQDSNYLTYCTSPSPANPALNQLSEGTTHRAKVAGTTDEEYAIDLIPAETAPSTDKKCDTANLIETMVEEQGAAAGTFRLESTGFSEGKQRTIVATFRNANFVSYVWYDVYETGDPAVYGEADEKEPAKYNLCGQFYELRPSYCATFNNFFFTGESVKGPMHTEDHVGICGSPVFGRTPIDHIEFGYSYNGDEGYSNEGCGTSASPSFKGTHIPPAEVPSLKPPPSDEELEHVVEPAYHFTEKTEIILEGTTMTIKTHVGSTCKPTEACAETKTSGVAFPPNGVIYVSGGCSSAYSPFGPKPTYTADTNCGNVYVRGEYTLPLTIASQNDVVINGNILAPHNSEGAPTSTAMLGLIANNFIRVYHPLEKSRTGPNYTECGSSENASNDLKEPTVYAAMLALKHAVIVDNFDCGKPTLGHLNVFGAVAALYSNGLTGVGSGGTIIHGYQYNANYDNRLQAEEPPHFLNPIQAAWYIQRETQP